MFGDVRIIDSYFNRNIGTRGGGAFLDEPVAAEVLGCTFEDNDGGLLGSPTCPDEEGGGLHLEMTINGGVGSIRNCLFYNNRADKGGGAFVHVTNGSSVNVDSCTFVENTSNDRVGGAGLGIDAFFTPTAYSVSNTIGWGNISLASPQPPLPDIQIVDLLDFGIDCNSQLGSPLSITDSIVEGSLGAVKPDLRVGPGMRTIAGAPAANVDYQIGKLDFVLDRWYLAQDVSNSAFDASSTICAGGNCFGTTSIGGGPDTATRDIGFHYNTLRGAGEPDFDPGLQVLGPDGASRNVDVSIGSPSSTRIFFQNSIDGSDALWLVVGAGNMNPSAGFPITPDAVTNSLFVNPPFFAVNPPNASGAMSLGSIVRPEDLEVLDFNLPALNSNLVGTSLYLLGLEFTPGGALVSPGGGVPTAAELLEVHLIP